MSTFQAGAVVGQVRLDTQGWTSRVKAVVQDAGKLKQSILGNIGGASKAAAHSVNELGTSMGRLPSLMAQVTGAAGIGLLARQFITAASTAENYRVRLEALMGSAKAGNQVFADMSQYARETAFQYEEIMGAATNLSGVLTGGPEQIARWIPLIGDLAAASGLSIQETTGQVQRMLSAGAAAADMFRERGVLAMLGFTSGVQYSAKESAEALIREWSKADSRFRGLASRLGDTWSGQVSMLIDKWFIFRNAVMDTGVFRGLVNGLKSVNAVLDDGIGRLQGWLQAHGEAVTRAVTAVGLLVGALAGVLAIKIAWTGLVATFGALGTVVGLSAGPAALLTGVLLTGAVAAGVHWNKTIAVFASFGEGIMEFTATVARAVAEWVGTIQQGTMRIGVFIGKLEIGFFRTLGGIEAKARWTASALQMTFQAAVLKVLGALETLSAFAADALGLARLGGVVERLQASMGMLRAEMAETSATMAGQWDSLSPRWEKLIRDTQGYVDVYRDMADADSSFVASLKGHAATADALATHYRNIGVAALTADIMQRDGAGAVKQAMQEVLDEAKKTVDMLLGIGGAADAGLGKAGKAAEDLAAKAQARVEALLPVKGIVESIRRDLTLLGSQGYLTDEVRTGMAAEAWGNMKDLASGAVNAIILQVTELDQALGRALDAHRVREMADEVSRVLQDLRPPEMVLRDDISAQFEVLKKAAALDQNTGTLLLAKYWDELRDKPAEFVRQLIKDLNSPELEAALDRLSFADLQERGGSIWKEWTGENLRMEAQADLQAVATYLASLGEAAKLTGEDVTAFVTEAMRRLSSISIDALQEIIANIPDLPKEIREQIEQAAQQIQNAWAKTSSGKDGWEGAYENIIRVGQGISQLGPKFQRVAQAAAITGDVIALAMSPDPVSMLINGLKLAADAMGLFGKKTEEVKEGWARAMEEIQNSVDSWVDDLTDAIVDFVKTGQTSFKELVDSILEDMLRIIIKYAVLQPLLGAIGINFNEKGNVFDQGNVVPFAKGGVVTRPTAFPMRKGIGLMGEAGPEAIVPLKRMASGALGVGASGTMESRVEVHIHDHRTAGAPPIEVKETRLPDGARCLEVIVADQVNKAIRSGAMDQSLRQLYGLQRRSV